MRIAHLSAEVSPLAKTGGLGDVVGALPKTLAELGHDVSVWMPYYRQVRKWLQNKGIGVTQALDPMRLDVGYARYQVGLLRTELPGSKVPLYLVAQDELFDRPEIYSPDVYGRDDGLRRYAVFVRAALEAMRRLQQVPDILHAHDWHAALAPMALRWDEPRDWHFGKTASVLTLHNAAYQGMYSPETFVSLGLPRAALSEAGLGWKGAVNLLKGAILAADAITAVSPTFAQEITTSEGGFGLDPVLRHRRGALVGIVNGIDPNVWNPAVDKKIPRTYDAEHLEGKLENRRALLQRAGMDPDDRGLVVGVVGRLVRQKGYDLLFPVLDELLGDGVRFVCLGSGEDELERNMHAYSHRRQGRFWGYVGFDDDLAHLVEAGADAFLMPSRFEPCGLNQLYSLAYGTPPIVRRVGGLADTVVSYDGGNAASATGFGFDDAYPAALRETVRWAHRAYRNPVLWTQLVRNGMARDFSWRRSAERYLQVYARIRR
jgi:starch synthase